MIGNSDYNVPDTRHKNKSFERGPELFYVDALNNQPANKKGKKSINQPPKRVEFSDPLNDVQGLLDGQGIFNQQREKPKI